MQEVSDRIAVRKAALRDQSAEDKKVIFTTELNFEFFQRVLLAVGIGVAFG